MMLVVFSVLLSAMDVSSLKSGNMSKARLGRTELLEDLRAHSAFKQKVSPGANDDIVDISFGFFHYQVLLVDELSQAVTSVGYISMSWLDSDLTWNVTDYAGIDRVSIANDEIWTPKLLVSNAADPDYIMIERSDSISLTCDGVVSYSTPAYLKTTCDIDVTYYPFDTQTCDIIFLPYIYDTNYSFSSSTLIEYNEVNLTGEWIVYNRSIEAKHADERGGTSIIRFTMKIRRRPLYYILCVLSPMLMTGFVSSMVFLLPPDSGEKISFLVTVFVTDAVFFNFIASAMPRNMSGIPRLPLFLVVINVQCVLAMIATVFVIRRHNAEQRNLLEHQDDSNSQLCEDNILVTQSAMDEEPEMRVESANPPSLGNRLSVYLLQKLSFSKTGLSSGAKPKKSGSQPATQRCRLRSATWNTIFFWAFNVIGTVCYLLVFLV